ncbi:MAG: hypothetical protein IPM50_13755 [Acidobacteriota bacterium]|nr:MAG: hypothetical protein IPM50_13755 [Acidobacteriota bacterium]
MRSLVLLSALFCFVLIAEVSGQTRTFRWSDMMCDYQGTYNSQKYTAKQLSDTVKLIEPGSYSISVWATVFHPRDLPLLSLDKLNDDFREQQAAINALQIVNVPYFQRLREKKLEEMRQVYELSRVTIAAHSEPSVLRTYRGADACKAKYAEPLIAGGDALLRTWREVNERSRSVNSEPERLRRDFEEQVASPDKMKFALVEVMGFGWWNCVNETVFRVESDGTAEKEFRKLFTRVRDLGCDGP